MKLLNKILGELLIESRSQALIWYYVENHEFQGLNFQIVHCSKCSIGASILLDNGIITPCYHISVIGLIYFVKPLIVIGSSVIQCTHTVLIAANDKTHMFSKLRSHMEQGNDSQVPLFRTPHQFYCNISVIWF
jgi:hypothetical protein